MYLLHLAEIEKEKKSIFSILEVVLKIHNHLWVKNNKESFVYLPLLLLFFFTSLRLKSQTDQLFWKFVSRVNKLILQINSAFQTRSAILTESLNAMKWLKSIWKMELACFPNLNSVIKSNQVNSPNWTDSLIWIRIDVHF